MCLCTYLPISSFADLTDWPRLDERSRLGTSAENNKAVKQIIDPKVQIGTLDM